MPSARMIVAVLLLACAAFTAAQQQCYYGPGAAFRAASQVVPCLGSGQSACCLLGDTCLSGHACFNYASGNTYQYGCTDVNYQDASCPFKCGFDPTLSPWTALEYCSNVPGVNDTWVCHAPESCGCDWPFSANMVPLAPRGCMEMGSEARVALFAPTVIAPYISLPSSQGGSTGYYSTTTAPGLSTTWVSTAIAGYTPKTIVPLTQYTNSPTAIVQVSELEDVDPFPTVSGTAVTGVTPSTSPNLSTRPNLNPSTSVNTISSVPVSAPSGNSTSAGTSQPTVSKPPSSLSTGAKAGVGVGVGVGASALGVAAIILYLKQKTRAKQELGAQTQHMPYPGEQQTVDQHGSPLPMYTEAYHADPSKYSWPQTPPSAQHSPGGPVPAYPGQYMYRESQTTAELPGDQQAFLRPSNTLSELPNDGSIHEIYSEPSVSPPIIPQQETSHAPGTTTTTSPTDALGKPSSVSAKP